MITLKFSATKANKSIVIIPALIIDYSEKAKNATVNLYTGWLNGLLSISINWTRKTK